MCDCNKTKITAEANGKKYTIEIPSDSNVFEHVECVTNLLINLGFCITCITDAYIAKIEEVASGCEDEDSEIKPSDFEDTTE